MPFGIPKGAMCVQRFDDSRKFCNSHYLSHFAAFFIDARTKRSVVESFNYYIVLGHHSHQELGGLWRARTSRSRWPGRAQRPAKATSGCITQGGRSTREGANSVMIPPQVHLRSGFLYSANT